MNNEGHTPLIPGARGDQIGVVRRLLANGGAQAMRGDTTKGRIALSWACRNGHTETADMLLAAIQFDVDSLEIESSRTALIHNARPDFLLSRSQEGNLEVVSIFLNNECIDVSGMTDLEYGRTALAWAAGDGHTAVVKLLLNQSHDRSLGCALDFYGQTALFWAAADGHESTVRALLAYDESDIGLVSKSGWTPLMWAASGGHAPVVEALFQAAKLGVNVKESKLGRTALSWAAAHSHAEVVSILLENNDIDIDLPDDEGFTPLFCPINHNHEVIVSLLLSTSVKVDVVDTSGRNPLILASELGYAGVVRRLLEVGHADVHIKDQRDQTALSLAVANGHDDVASILIEFGRAEVPYPGDLIESPSPDEFVEMHEEKSAAGEGRSDHIAK
ncbi:unnamed protein product [Alternaria burnsii]|nr:unnamed protein product [Alternaria burnsii]